MGARARIYTKTGDDGTTGLLYGGRVRKDDAIIEVNGTVDEAQAALGLARADSEPGSELDQLLVSLERDLWVLMAEVATRPENRHKLSPGATLVTQAMVDALEGHIDDLLARFEMPAAFVVPGQSRTSALLDLARTVVRRAERLALSVPACQLPAGETGPDSRAHDQPDDLTEAPTTVPSLVGPYLNRLSDLCWAMARWQEDQHLLARATESDPQ